MLLKVTGVISVDAVRGAVEGRFGEDLDVGFIFVTVLAEVFCDVGVLVVVVEDELAESDAGEAAIDVFLHYGIEVGNFRVGVGSNEGFVEIVFIIVAGEGIDFGFDEIFALIKEGKKSGKNN